MTKPVVVITRKLPDATETRMMELFDTRLNETDIPLTRRQLETAVAEADVLVPTVTDRIDAELLEKAGSQLRLIASFGTGIDHIDLEAARAKGIVVTNTPGVLTEDTADMVMALILGVARRISEGVALVRSGEWLGWGPTVLLGTRLAGKRLGIIGMGRIGQAVARRARAFGMTIHYHNRHRVGQDIEEELEATYWQSLDQMLSRMDVISVNCPHTPATYHLLNRRRLSLLQPHAILVNTSRGEVVDEEILIELLKSRDIGGAGLDVFENEPAVNPDLLDCPNTVLTPHIGSATRDGRLAMGDRVLINIKTFTDGHRPPDRVLSGLDDS
ncbi:MAG: D-glycerate dehydrogenase [Alphaproteobacteria bacterium]